MRARTAVALLALLAVCALADEKDVALTAAVGAPNTVAIVIGIDKYDSADITHLDAAVADARGFAQALKDRRGAGESNIRLLTSEAKLGSLERPSKPTIVLMLEWAGRIVKAEDTFIFYFAGHGLTRWGESYLLPIEANLASANVAAMTSLSLEDLKRLLGGIHSAHQIVIMDCCRNDPERDRGAKPNEASSTLVRDIEIVGRAGADEAGAKSSAVLFSCSEGERAFECPDGKHGVFTKFLIEGLKGAAAREGEVRLSDLEDYVETHVPRYLKTEPGYRRGLKQTPWHKSEGSGRVVLAMIAGPGDFEDVLKPALVTLTSDPPGAEVIFDGKPTGWKTPCTMPIENLAGQPQTHEFGVRLEGYAEQAKRGTLAAGAKLRLDFGKLLAMAPPKREGERDVIVTPVTPPPVPDKIVGPTPGGEKIGPDGGVMVWVPPGEFMMGSEDGLDDEKPAHKVRITKGFWLGKCEVTNEQYRAFCQATGRTFPGESTKGPKHPVGGVTSNDAKAYCDHYGLSLPTEAQWEYAARGEQGLRYPWGNEWDAKRYCNSGIGFLPVTMEVGSLPAGNSWCGACDMAGNVWERCADWYDEDYYAKSPSADPTGASTGMYRVLRGGSWGDDPGDCRASNRCRLNPVYGYGYNGFRACALSK